MILNVNTIPMFPQSQNRTIHSEDIAFGNFSRAAPYHNDLL